MSNAESNEQELSAAERQRIDEFSRELALALQRIIADAEVKQEICLPGNFQANPIQIKGAISHNDENNN